MKPAQLLGTAFVAALLLFGLLTFLVFDGKAEPSVLVEDIQRGLLLLGGVAGLFHLAPKREDTPPKPPGDSQPPTGESK